MAEPRPPSAATALGVAAGALLALWTPVEGLVVWLRTRGAEAAALVHPPVVAFDLPAAVAGVGLLGWAAVALVRRVPGSPAYRLVPMAGVVVVFAKLFVLPDVTPPPWVPDPAAIVVEAAQRIAGAGLDAAEAGDGTLPEDPAALAHALEGLGRPLYVFRGEPVTAYRIDVRHGCDGPAGDRGDAPPGTITYCLAEDRRRGWVGAVALPGLAGTPDLVRDEAGRAWGVEMFPSSPSPPGYDGAQEGGRRLGEAP